MTGDFDFIVLLPVWRRDDPELLQLALNSIFENSLRPREVLLCQDGPIPASLEAVLARYPLHRHLNQGKPGLHHNLNVALPQIDAAWIARADADDINLPTRFSVQADRLRQSPKIDVLGSDIDEIWANGRVTRKTMPADHAAIARMARFRSPINHNTAFIRTTALKAVGGYPEIDRREDYALWMKMITQGYKFGNVPSPLVRMSLGEDFLWRRSAGAVRAEMELGKLRTALPGVSPPIAMAVTAARTLTLATQPLLKPIYTLLRR